MLTVDKFTNFLNTSDNFREILLMSLEIFLQEMKYIESHEGEGSFIIFLVFNDSSGVVISPEERFGRIGICKCYNIEESFAAFAYKMNQYGFEYDYKDIKKHSNRLLEILI